MLNKVVRFEDNNLWSTKYIYLRYVCNQVSS